MENLNEKKKTIKSQELSHSLIVKKIFDVAVKIFQYFH